MFAMNIRIIRIDEDIVEIHNDVYIDHVREYFVDELLPSCRSISKAKWHDIPFVRSPAGSERRFPFVAFMNVNQMVCMFEVDLGINARFPGRVEEIRYERKRVSILFRDFIQTAEIDAKSELSIFLWSE